MNVYLKNILAVIGGWFTGSILNMLLIQLGHKTLPIEGLDPNNMESLAAIMPTLSFKYFIFPFLAHAIGTFTGAFVAGKIAQNNKMKYSLGIGLLFFIGGVMVNYLINGPVWFSVIDLTLAYFPMAWLAGKMATK